MNFVIQRIVVLVLSVQYFSFLLVSVNLICADCQINRGSVPRGSVNFDFKNVKIQGLHLAHMKIPFNFLSKFSNEVQEDSAASEWLKISRGWRIEFRGVFCEQSEEKTDEGGQVGAGVECAQRTLY